MKQSFQEKIIKDWTCQHKWSYRLPNIKLTDKERVSGKSDLKCSICGRIREDECWFVFYPGMVTIVYDDCRTTIKLNQFLSNI